MLVIIFAYLFFRGLLEIVGNLRMESFMSNLIGDFLVEFFLLLRSGLKALIQKAILTFTLK